MKLYHGSDQIIKNPSLNHKSNVSDYGNGFYMTKDIELAKEWASKNLSTTGYVNEYDVNISNLKVLDLTSDEYSPLHWISLLIKNRKISNSSRLVIMAKEYLLKYYFVDLNEYDVVIGYRADDSYFAFIKAFIRNEIDINQLEEAIKLGNLGKQYFLHTEKAFQNIEFTNVYEVEANSYFKKRQIRETNARKQYNKIMGSKLPSETILEIMKNDNR